MTTQEHDILDDESPPLETIVTVDDAAPINADILQTVIKEFYKIGVAEDRNPQRKQTDATWECLNMQIKPEPAKTQA